MRTDGHTDMTKIIVAFRNFANASKKTDQATAGRSGCYNFQRPGSVRNVAHNTSLMLLFIVKLYRNPPAAPKISSWPWTAYGNPVKVVPVLNEGTPPRFLTSVLDGCERSLSHANRFMPVKPQRPPPLSSELRTGWTPEYGSNRPTFPRSTSLQARCYTDWNITDTNLLLNCAPCR